jgi:hypothetical protein
MLNEQGMPVPMNAEDQDDVLRWGQEQFPLPNEFRSA